MRTLKIILRVFIVSVSIVVVMSSLIVLTAHAEMVLIYGPQVATLFAWAAVAAIACGIVATLGMLRSGRRP